MELTPKQQRFIEYYTDKDSVTFGNATRSYIKAGYKDGPSVMQAACRLLSNVKIKKAIEAYRAKNGRKKEVTKEYITSKLQSILDTAVEKGDLTNANTTLRLLGQSIAMYTDKYQDDSQDNRKNIPKELLEEYQKDAKRLTKPNIKLKKAE